MGKGSHRRPEDRAAIERNWPFPSPTRTEEPEDTKLRGMLAKAEQETAARLK